MNAPVRILRSTIIDAPVDAVWRLLRDFNAHESWHPAIAASRIEAGEPPDTVGAVRAFRLADGSALREQLISLSDRDRELTYCLLEAPLPLMDYVATMRLRPVTDGDCTFMTWQSRFRPPEEQAEALKNLVAHDIYEAGFRALKQRFEQPRAGQRERVGSSAVGPHSIAPALFPHAEVPAEGGPRSTQSASDGSWTILRGRSDYVGAAPEDEVVVVQRSFARPLPSATALSDQSLAARAIVVPAYGGAEVMEFRTISVPPPGPGEVRLRHTAIGVNYIDIYCRTGYFRLLTPPGVPGMEAAGVVLDVGDGVSHLRPGQRVVYACEPVGAYAEARTMPATLLVPLPDDIDDETAAASFLKGLSAEFMLHTVHKVTQEETVLVHAAAGGVGLFLCQWASAIGARVIGVVSNEAKAEQARDAGGAEVFLYDRDDVVGGVMRLTGGRGADVIYDGVGAATFEQSLEMLAPRGHLVSFGQASGPIGSTDVGSLASKSVTLSRPNFGHYTTDPDELRAMSAHLFDALRRRILRPVHQPLPLVRAADAHRMLEKRENIGAVVLVP